MDLGIELEALCPPIQMTKNERNHMKSSFLNFSLNVHVFYDDTFNAQFGSDATTRITAIFTIVETIYSDASLSSVIDPNIIQISYITGASWEATEPILRYQFDVALL